MEVIKVGFCNSHPEMFEIVFKYYFFQKNFSFLVAGIMCNLVKQICVRKVSLKCFRLKMN